MEYKELPAVWMMLSDWGGAFLCGRAQKSLIEYFQNFDYLGIISADQWYVLDMGILPYEGEEGGWRNPNHSNGESGDFFSIIQIPSWKPWIARREDSQLRDLCLGDL